MGASAAARSADRERVEVQQPRRGRERVAVERVHEAADDGVVEVRHEGTPADGAERVGELERRDSAGCASAASNL